MNKSNYHLFNIDYSQWLAFVEGRLSIGVVHVLSVELEVDVGRTFRKGRDGIVGADF